MVSPETILEACGEMAEKDYIRAKAGGTVDPVIELMAMDPADPNQVSVSAWERSEIVAMLRDKSAHAAKALETPAAFDRFSIIIALPKGCHIYDRLIPTG